MAGSKVWMLALVCGMAMSSSAGAWQDAATSAAKVDDKTDAKADDKSDAKPEAGTAKKDDAGKKKEPKQATKSTFAAISARSIGPGFPSGRISDLVVNPANHSEWYIAVASGNVWKTSNGGLTFRPIFEGYGSYSIGCLRMDPSNPATIWVGSGENNSQRSVGYGDGVYLSRDGGKSFTNMGLKESEHIGMIQVDPRDSNTVYVAAQGPLWKPGGDRGLYKSINGGTTWRPILQISENTGINEVHLDPRDPETIYAVSYQRRRHVWTLINGGPETAIYKSINGGESWRKLTNGIPAGDKGKIGLAIAPAQPDTIYAIIEAAEGESGVFRSTDRGETWTKRSSYVSGSPQYYNELIPDPKNPERVYSMDTFMNVSDDGGATFKPVGERDKHVDNHALWINPNNTDHLLVGCDGGLYDSFDRGQYWRHYPHLPVVQYYRVAVDNSEPFYYVYGGTQDNNTHGGPSRTTDRIGIANEDWFVTTGGDGFEVQVDPTDPNIVYTESQDGGLVRFDRASGEEVDIKPKEKKGQEPFVFNWDTPILISPHKSTRLYMAGNYLLKSDDRGDSWTVISPNLTRGLDRNQLKVMGVIQKPEAVAKHMSTSIFGNAVSLSESPKVEGLLYVGTDDGLLHVSEDGGTNWRKVENFPIVPEMTYISDLEAGQHSADTVFAAFENHKMGDFTPYLLRSDDRGRTWKSIAGDLPARGEVLTIAEDHVNPKLLFVGTEFGAYYTLDGGQKWFKFSGLPTIAVRDLEIQRREGDLAMATFGRGFYIVDDYSPLRNFAPEVLDKDAHIFPIKPAVAYVEESRLGGTSGRGYSGATNYAAKNPPLGATITYFLKDSHKSLKEKRKEAMKGENWKYPTIDEFRAEDREDKAEAYLTIRDGSGAVARRMAVSGEAGVHRTTWNLRYPETSPIRIGGSEKMPWELNDAGVLAPPGTYSAQVATLIDGVWKDLGEPVQFEVKDLNLATLAAKDAARQDKFTFERKLTNLTRAIAGASRVLGEVEGRIRFLRAAVLETPTADVALLKEIDSFKDKVQAIRDALSGDPTFGKRMVAETPSISERVMGAVSGLAYTTQPPTGTQREQYEIAAADFEAQLAALKSVIETELPAIERKLEQAGAPWTPGRLPEWKK
ncbi:MAG: glycosyl hydrolase [Planctomycetes bacterium]|nr:glycosyl hydrolase [Planctomycetota bacterium]